MNGKKVLGVLLLLFAVFFIFTQPVEAANLLRSTFEALARLASAGAEAFSTFIRTLF